MNGNRLSSPQVNRALASDFQAATEKHKEVPFAGLLGRRLKQGCPRSLLSAFFTLLFIFAWAAPAWAAVIEIPAPQGDIYVQDFQHLLNQEQKDELNRLGRALEGATKAQVAVLTVPTIGEESVEQYANRALRQYKLGDAKLNNGVLLVVSLSSQQGASQLRIEVGYGLEGAIPDGKAGRILDEVSIPYFQQNKPDQAIIETYKTLYNEVATEYKVQDKLHPESVVLPSPGSSQSGNEGGGISIFWVIIIIGLMAVDFIFFRGFITMTLLSILGRGGRGGGGGGGGFNGGGGGSSGGGGAGRRF
ncbi:uncharacterized protein J2Z69_002587 [Paenibacillus shirakamiensis]|uniref:TPM domain-containing protein n=1 Tax=Paenibacillus shirakamiensis TaxID=1265935 RepID=A0ABS4JIL8_9BACL|nr:TPM domain-containing protein [Paenibacillus shirakamiensis]MBP2001542.1 uncharacterized protein [Paenibacillus shirakamiensis]